MKATELRIGNIVVIEIHPAPPMLHRIKAKDILDIDGGLIIVDSLLINENILTKCGFKKNPRHSKEYFFSSNRPIWFRFYDNALYYEYNSRDKIIIRFVHELQNLIFALTKKELNIDL